MANKVLVAVHGIGEQIRCETIQSVSAQLCRYYSVPPSVPLGRLTANLVPVTENDKVPGVLLAMHPPDPAALQGLGFAEVYWADIPRGPAKNLYTLEEAKKWAHTVVQRVRAMELEQHPDQAGKSTDYDLVARVIDEMIEGTRVLEQVLFLASRLTSFTFDLKQTLVDYLGDVQVVVDFENYRKKIVGLFQSSMARIQQAYADAEIFVVAHSEGTVVSYLGLLEAFHRLDKDTAPRYGSTEPPDWVKQVRGLMTIGSPINKHLLLWPELWDGLTPPSVGKPAKPIPWKNYYDLGDPVGFRLTSTEEWMNTAGWGDFFQLQDIGFTRYYFAGKAHNDYWQDDAVFGHFLGTVVNLQPPAGKAAPAPPPAPGNNGWAVLLSPSMPYLLAFGIILLAVYFIYHAVGECLALGESELAIGRSVLGIGLLLAGITAAVRIPRLIHHPGWRIIGLSCFFIGAGTFPFVIGPGFQDRLAGLFRGLFQSTPLNELPERVLGIPWPILIFLSILGACGVIAFLISRYFPNAGAKPLILVGAVVLVLFLVFRLEKGGAFDQYLVIRQTIAAEEPEVQGSELELLSSKVFRDFRSNPQPDKDARQFAFQAVLARQEIARVPDKSSSPASDPTAPDTLPDLIGGAKRTAPDGARELKLPRVKRYNASAVDRSPSLPEAGNDQARPKPGPIWPVVLGGALFLYLWWLAVIWFDLVVTWHHYIRRSAVVDRLKERCT